MKKLTFALLVLLLVGCSKKPTALVKPFSSLDIEGLHTLAIKAAANGDKLCYHINQPENISGDYCLQYKSK
jgi:uncharacterized protein YcfL